MATVTQLKDRIYRSTNGQYTDSFHMLDLLNDALNMMVEGAKIRNKASVYVSSGANNYPLPADFKAPGILQDETEVNSIVPYELVDISENRFGYAIEAGYLYIKPNPTQDVTLTHYYYKYATTLVEDTDTPTEIDSQYHDLLSTYAIAMILPLLPNPDKGMIDRWWSRWQDGLKGFIESSSKKNRSSRAREKVVW
jgi:hypothetical protein